MEKCYNKFREEFRKRVEEFLLAENQQIIIKSLGFENEIFIKNILVIDLNDVNNIIAIVQFSEINSVEMSEHKIMKIKLNTKKFNTWMYS